MKQSSSNAENVLRKKRRNLQKIAIKIHDARYDCGNKIFSAEEELIKKSLYLLRRNQTPPWIVGNPKLVR